MADNPDSITLKRVIHRSGIATVWEGYDTKLHRKVLVKDIHPQLVRDPEIRARLDREAQAIARLSHTNVVQIYDLHLEEDQARLVLEWVEGKDLREVLREQGALPPDRAVMIAEEILAGLECAHAAGIIHRDLTPANVMISTGNEAKITDFGLAMLRDLPAITQPGALPGTPWYMAPEQVSGGEITAATDIFALGLILFEMLTGRRVIEGNQLEAIQRLQKYQPLSFEELEQESTAALVPILRRMLELEPEKRFASAGEARTALLQSQQAGFLPDTLPADDLPNEPVRQAAVQSEVHRRKWLRPLHLGAIAVFMVVMAVVIVISRKHRERENATQMECIFDAFPPPRTTPAVVQNDTIPPPEETTPQEKPHRVVETKIASKPVELPAATGPGLVDIICQPWARVSLGDSLIGTTPLRSLKLPAGHYDLYFYNPEIGQRVKQPVVVTTEQTTALHVNMLDHVASIRAASVKPWADVYVDGKLEMRTPSTKTVFRPLGSVTITLKCPGFRDSTYTVTFRQGDPAHEIRADLTHQ
jgi:serine/threonine protein kinase